MIPQGNALATIGMVKSDYSGGKRLYEAAFNAVDECGHEVLDPIHVVFAACIDESAPTRVKDELRRYGITQEMIEAVLALIDTDLSQKPIVKIDDGEAMGSAAVDMYAALTLRFNTHVKTLVDIMESTKQREDSHWSFYVMLFLTAIESDAASILQLRTLASRAQS